MRARHKIWVCSQKMRQQCRNTNFSATVSERVGILPDLELLIHWPEASSKSWSRGRKLSREAKPLQQTVQSSANAKRPTVLFADANWCRLTSPSLFEYDPKINQHPGSELWGLGPICFYIIREILISK